MLTWLPLLCALLSPAAPPAPRATVYVFLADTCPVSQRAAVTVRELYFQYSGQGVGFGGVFPSAATTDADLTTFAKTYRMPFVLRCDRDHLEMQLHGCPLKDAWREAGLPEEKIATLCRIAGAVDKGLFQGAGFKFENKTWVPGAKGCCFLSITSS